MEEVTRWSRPLERWGPERVRPGQGGEVYHKINLERKEKWGRGEVKRTLRETILGR